MSLLSLLLLFDVPLERLNVLEPGFVDRLQLVALVYQLGDLGLILCYFILQLVVFELKYPQSRRLLLRRQVFAELALRNRIHNILLQL